jgi:hypothetical protein
MDGFSCLRECICWCGPKIDSNKHHAPVLQGIISALEAPRLCASLRWPLGIFGTCGERAGTLASRSTDVTILFFVFGLA